MPVAASPPLRMAPPDPLDLGPLDPDDPDDPQPGQTKGQPAGKPAGNAPRSFLFDDPALAAQKPQLAGSPPAASKPAAGKPAPAPARSAAVTAPPAPRPGVPFSLKLRGGWSTLAWRCAVIYAVLFCLPFPYHTEALKPFAQAFRGAHEAIVPWLGQRVGLTLAVPLDEDGSGDTSYHWFWLACVLTVSLLLGAAWHLLRWNKRPGPRARDALRTFMRYWLGGPVLSYGSAKLIPHQFGTVDAETLSTRFGDASPMGLLWTFHGWSPAYTVFTGLIEAAAGMLLFWRGTALLGALFTAAAMAQVAMLNFCYDVPVKILSTHLFAFAVLLCVRDAARLFDLFVRNRPVAAAELWPWWEARWLRMAARVVQLALIAGLVFAELRQNLGWGQPPDAPLPPHAGTWQVETFARDGVEIAPFTAPT